MRPFILGFAEAIPCAEASECRYDADRQLSQTLTTEGWVDSLDTHEPEDCATKKTAIDRETTDDE